MAGVSRLFDSMMDTRDDQTQQMATIHRQGMKAGPSAWGRHSDAMMYRQARDLIPGCIVDHVT